MIRVLANKPTNKEVVDSSLKELGLRLDVYDQILSKQKYIAGDVSRVFFFIYHHRKLGLF